MGRHAREGLFNAGKAVCQGLDWALSLLTGKNTGKLLFAAVPREIGREFTA